MGVTLYNLDKVDRETFKIKVGGVEHDISEPTVKDFTLIQQIDFKEPNAQFKIFEIMCPTVNVEDLGMHQMTLLAQICNKLIMGVDRKKIWEVEELKM